MSSGDDLARFLEALSMPTLSVDATGKVNAWNAAISKLTGYSKEQTMGKHLSGIVCEKSQDSADHMISSTLKNVETAHLIWLSSSSGESTEMLMNATARRDDKGGICGCTVFCQRVAELPQPVRQHVTTESVERPFEPAHAPVFGVDVHGVVNAWNKQLAALTGYTKEEAMGKPLVQAFVGADHRDAAQAALASATCGDRDAEATVELSLAAKSGRQIELQLTATPVQDASGSVVGVLGVGQDITRLHEALNEAARVADDMHRMIDTANAPILGINAGGLVTEWNTLLVSTTGWDAAYAKGRHLVDSFVPDDRREEISKVLRLALQGHETPSFEFALTTMEGSTQPIMMSAIARRGGDNEINGVICIGQYSARQPYGGGAQASQTLLKTANVPFFGVDRQFNVSEWNEKIVEITGFERQEALGRPLVRDLVPAKHQHRIQEMLSQAMGNKEISNFEFPMVTKTGKGCDLLLNTSVLRDDSGNAVGAFAVGLDITSMRKALTENSRIADDLLRVMDTMNAPIIGIDKEGCVTEWNQRIAEISGYGKVESLGKPFVRCFVSATFQEEVGKVIKKALNGTSTSDFVFSIFTKDGYSRRISFSCSARRGPSGEVTGVIGVGTDAQGGGGSGGGGPSGTSDWRRLVDTANVPMFGVDINANVNEWNAKATELTGFSKIEVWGSPLAGDFIPSKHRERVSAVLAEALRGIETASFEFPLCTKGGHQIDILLNVTTRRDESGTIIGVFIVGQDITKMRRALTANSRVADDLTRLIDTANAPILGIDTEGTVTEWNQKAAEITGYGKEESLGRRFVGTFISEQYQAEVDHVLTSALIGKDAANYTVPLFTKDGRKRELSLNATARRGPSGEITGVIGIGQDITEFNEISAQNERLAADWQRLIDTANAPIFGVDVEGNVNEWNKKAAEISGFSRDETIGRPLVREFITPEHRERVQAVLDEAMSGVETGNFEFPLATKDGRRIDILLNATTKRDQNSKVCGVFGVGQDITKLRQALTENTRIADDMTRLIDTANAPILGIDTEGSVTVWNQKAAGVSGFGKAEALGKHFISSFITEKFREEVSGVLNRALAGRDTADYTFPLFTKDGRRREICLNATARRGPSGEIIGVIGVGQDVTELNNIMAQNQRFAADWKRLIQTANAPIFGVDNLGHVNEWNAKAADISGFSKNDTMGRHLVQEFITPEHRARVQAVLTEALKGDETANFEFPLATKDGKRVDILLNATTKRDEHGAVVGVLGVGQDITTLKAALTDNQRIADDLMRLIDTANAPILGIDTQGRVTEWNQKAADVSGYGKQETLGKAFVETFISEKFRNDVSQVLTKALSGTDTANYTFPLFTKDGRRREISLNATARRGPTGEITGVIGVGQDITELNRIMAQNARLASDWQRLIERANAPIFGVDIKGLVNEWNAKAADISGFSKQEALGRPLVTEFITPDHRERVQIVLTEALKGDETANFEFPLATKTGKRIDILLNATTKRDENGAVVGVLGVGQDITNLRAALTDNQRIADDLMRLIDTANAPILGVDLEGNVNEWNQKAADVSGHSKHEAMGKHFVSSFISENYRDEVRHVLTKACSGTDTANYTFPLFTKDGRRREISLNATARRGPSGEVIGCIGVGQDITEIKQISAQNSRLAADWQRLIETANAPIFGVDVQGLVLEWNAKAAEISGFSKKETIGKPLVREFITPEHRERVQMVLSMAMTGDETSNFEFPLATKDGKRIDILLNATTKRDERGAVVGVLGVGQDITNLRRALTENQRIAEDLTRLIDTANAPIIGIDTQGRVTEWNLKAKEVSGYGKSETLGKNFVESFTSPDYRDEVNAVLDKACAGTDTATYIFPLFTKEGRRREMSLNATARRGPAGEIIGVICVGQDITELNRLSAQNERLALGWQRLIETANAPIFGVDSKGNVNEWNAKAAEISGFSKEETMGRPLVREFIAWGHRERVQEVLNEAMNGKETANFEFPLACKDGTRIDILLNATSKRDQAGAVNGVLGVGQDITNLRKALTENSRIADDLMRLIDTAHAPILGIDTEGRVTEWNQKAAEVTGYGKEESIGKPFTSTFISADFCQEVSEVLSQALAGTDTATYVFPLYTKDGRRREISLNATARRGPTGEVIGVIGVGQDITELNKISAQNERLAADWQRLIETANAPIFGVDASGFVNEWNSKAAELSGFSKEETMGRPLVREFIFAEHRERVSDVLTEALKGDETANFEFPLATKDGKRIDILLNATTRRDETGSVVGVLGVGQDITNLRAALTDNQRIADDLTRLIDTANAPIFGIDPDGCVNEWNQKAAEISGYTRAETIGKSFVDCFMSDEHRNEGLAVQRKALSGDDTANFKLPLLTKDGRRREISLNATARRGADGEIIGVIGVGQDMTDFERSRAEAMSIAEDLQRLIESANAPIIGVDIDGNVTEWNKKAVKVTGFSREECLGQHLISEFITPENSKNIQGVLTQACNGFDTANFEVPFITKDGKQVAMLLNATARRDANSTVTGVIMVGQDISALRQAMNEVASSADDLERIIDTANAPIFGLNTFGRITQWNQKTATITGFRREEAEGKPFVDEFIPPDKKVEVQRVLSMALDGEDTANYEVPIMTKTGHERFFLLNATTRRNADGEITGVIGVGQDFTELKELMAEHQRVADDWTRLIDTANAPIFGVNVDLNVTIWNRIAAERSGYAKEEAIGLPLVERFIDEEYKTQVAQVLSLAIQGHDTSNFEFALLTKDGKRIIILLNATPRRDANGKVYGVFGVGQNITELRESTYKAKIVADDLARLIDSANAPIFGIDLQGRVVEWNNMLYKITGFDKASVLGKPMVQSFIHLHYHDDVNDVFKRALAGEEVANMELKFYTKTGTHRDLSINATARIGSDGQVTGVIGVGQDVTEINIQRKELERVAGNLRLIVDYANAPIIGVNVGCLVNEFNNAAAEISGWAKEDIIGKSLVEHLVANDKRPTVAFVLLQALSGQDATDFEFPLLTTAGEQRQVTMNFTALRGVDGDVEGVICIGIDITDMRKMSAEQQNVAEDFKRVVRSANAPIIGVNIHGEVNEWNDKAASLSGFSREEVMGKPLVETFIREEERAVVREAIHKACRGIETTNFEFPLIHRDKSEVIMLLNAATRTDASGEIVGMVGVGQDITTLRQAVNEIAESRDAMTAVAEDFRRIIDHANAPILGIDTHGRVMEWNQKLAEISQYSKEEMMGKPFIEAFIIEEYQDEVSRVMNMALEGIETDNYEFSIVAKNGSRREILLNAATRRGPDGKVTGVIGVGQDITSIRGMTSECERVAEDLKRLIETANAPIFAVNSSGEITEWNSRSVEITGYTKQDTMGQHLVKQFIHPVHRRSVRAVLNQALTSHEVANFELTIYTRGGEQRDILLSATPRWGQNGEINGVVCVGQDVTQMKKHREHAERVADDYSRLINTANAPILGTDLDGCVNEWNRWVARGSGYTKDEVRGQPLTNYVAEACQATVLNVLEDASRGEPTDAFEVELAPKSDEKPVWLLLNATPRVSPQGDIIGVICVGQDITNIREIEQKRSSFMSAISHELKSPLNNIINLSADAVGEEEAGQSHLDIIHNYAIRMLDIVNNIMDTSDLVQDIRMKLSRDQVQMEDIIDEVVQLCRSSQDRQSAKLVKPGVQLISSVDDLPSIEADRDRCSQLVYNLVANALKFTHQGVVKISASADHRNEEILISVEDTGIGIASENLDRIFEPFDQVGESTTGSYEGLGLGLAICREVANEHGGSLSVTSEKRKGSQFRVKLPFKMPELGVDETGGKARATSSTQRQGQLHRVAQPPMPNLQWLQEDMAALPGPVSTGSLPPGPTMSLDNVEGLMEDRDIPTKSTMRAHGGSPNILYVDDDPLNDHVVCKALNSHYNVQKLNSGAECLQHLQECAMLPDLVLMDFFMPGLSGLEVLAAIRATYTLTELPVVMVSSSNSTAMVAKGLSKQCNDWIHKPFDRKELLARVGAQIRFKGLVQEQLADRVHKDVLTKLLPSQAVQQLVDGDVSKVDLKRIQGDLRRHFGGAGAVAAAKESSKEEASAASAARAELLRLQASVDSMRAKQKEASTQLGKIQDKLADAHAEKRKLEKDVGEAQSRLTKLKEARAKSESELKEAGAAATARRASSSSAPAAAASTTNARQAAAPSAASAAAPPAPTAESAPPVVEPAAPATGAARAGTSNAVSAIADVISGLQNGKLQPREAQMALQLSHLMLDVRLKDQAMAELKAQLRQQTAMLEAAEEKCQLLERALKRARTDAIVFGVPTATGLPWS